MKEILYPCYGCTRRFIGCHSTCKEYLDAQAANKAAKEQRWKDRSFESYWVRIVCKSKDFQVREKMRRR